MAELVFFCGTMDCGKSTLALQLDLTHRRRGRRGLVFTQLDRAGEGVLSSRLGLRADALEVTPHLDFFQVASEDAALHGRVDYLVCDEAQFCTPEQVEQLARLVDEAGVDVYAFGITVDFRSRLFPGSQRLVELADRVEPLQLWALCWCGARATHNARVVAGRMVLDGDRVVVGDSPGRSTDRAGEGAEEPEVTYEVLCRRHYQRRMIGGAG